MICVLCKKEEGKDSPVLVKIRLKGAAGINKASSSRGKFAYYIVSLIELSTLLKHHLKHFLHNC